MRKEIRRDRFVREIDLQFQIFMECMHRLTETYSRSNREIRGKRDMELDLVNELVNDREHNYIALIIRTY